MSQVYGGPEMQAHMTCTCGSGAHPRHCEVHPDNYAKHVAELQKENDELLTDEERAEWRDDIQPLEAVRRIRADLYSGRTTIRSMSFEDRMLAQQHGVITGHDVSFAFWDGSSPPPAAIRCHVSKRERLGPNTESVAGCMLLAGHDGECDFT